MWWGTPVTPTRKEALLESEASLGCTVKPISEKKNRGWRDDPVVKSTGFTFREPKFNS